MIFIIYWIISYWALEKVWYSRHDIIVFNYATFIFRKLVFSMFLGVILIPIALVMVILRK
jgi:hypothetical protein